MKYFLHNLFNVPSPCLTKPETEVPRAQRHAAVAADNGCRRRRSWLLPGARLLQQPRRRGIPHRHCQAARKVGRPARLQRLHIDHNLCKGGQGGGWWRVGEYGVCMVVWWGGRGGGGGGGGK